MEKLPWNIRSEINEEYENSIKQLEFLLDNKPRKFEWIDEEYKDFIELLLFLSIFYRRVVYPIEGASTFTQRLQRVKANGIKTGRDTYTRGDFEKIDQTIKHFKIILRKYNLNKYILSYTRIEKFLEMIYKRYYKGD